MYAIPERIGDFTEMMRKMMDSFGFGLRVCVPGIVESFDRTKQTVVVKVAIKERILNVINGDKRWEEIPPLLDVPIVVPRAGGYGVFPSVKKGDECLVVFGDMCMDAWWQSGGVQNQVEKRRHDLSDGFAILGCWSQPRVIPNYPTDGIQVRNDAGNAKMEIIGETINIMTAGTVNIGSGDVVIDSRVFMKHTHSGVVPGGGNTGGVV
jgi:hypothetical protein